MTSEESSFNVLFSELPLEIQEEIKNDKTTFTQIDGKKYCLCNDMRISGIKCQDKDFILTFHRDLEKCEHPSLQYTNIILKLDSNHIEIDFSCPPSEGEVISLIKPYHTSFYPAILDRFGATLVVPTGTQLVVCKTQYPDYQPSSKDTKQKLRAEIVLLKEGHAGGRNRYHIVQDETYLKCHCSESDNIKQDNQKCVIC